MEKIDHAHADQLPEEGEEFEGAEGFDEPWDWLSEEEDEDTRKYLAWFEDHVKAAYKGEQKIRGCAVDMEWYTTRERRIQEAIAIAKDGQNLEQQEMEEAEEHENDNEEEVPKHSATPPTVVHASVATTEASDADERQSVHRHDQQQQQEQQQPGAEWQPTPPRSPQRLVSILVSKVRLSIIKGKSERCDATKQQKPATSAHMAGSPANALRKGGWRN